tara:strand:+ start:1757 stop:1915 length:159 start_codon:yes stop_codon:yes gene_type:complete
MTFKNYKIRDGKHIPDEAYKQGWLEIFGKKETDKKKVATKKHEQKNNTPKDK